MKKSGVTGSNDPHQSFQSWSFFYTQTPLAIAPRTTRCTNSPAQGFQSYRCVSVCARPYYVLRAWDLGGTCVHVKWRPVLIMSLFVSCQSAAVHIHHVQGRTAQHEHESQLE